MVTNGLFNWENGQTVAFRNFTKRFTNAELGNCQRSLLWHT